MDDAQDDEQPDEPDDQPDHRRWFQPPSALLAIVTAVVLVAFGGVVGWALTEREPEPAEHDVRFLQDMITHHEQAVTMSELALAGVTDTGTRRFAEEVLFFQARELGIMQFLLEGWDVDLAERPDVAMEWMDMEVPLEQMPGMASEAEMAELQAATGDDVDRLFLELMIDHHLGGLHMARWAAEHADDADVRDLADVMARNQAQEVAEYQGLQERLGFEVTGN